MRPNGSNDQATTFARIYRWFRYTLSEEWRLVRELLALFQELTHPVILRFKLRLTRRSIKNRRREWVRLLGREVFENPPAFTRFSESLDQNPAARKILLRIDSLDRLEGKIEEQILIFEDAHSQQILSGLSAKLAEKQLETRVIPVRNESPYLGLSIEEARMRASDQGIVFITAHRKGFVLSGRTLLREEDLIVGIVPAFAIKKEEVDAAWGIDHRQVHPMEGGFTR